MIKFDDPKNWVCPICENRMGIDRKSPPDRSCGNGCFTAHTDYGETQIYGVSIYFDDGEGQETFYDIDDDGRDVIKERIKYWREDYRYLAEILERG